MLIDWSRILIRPGEGSLRTKFIYGTNLNERWNIFLQLREQSDGDGNDDGVVIG